MANNFLYANSPNSLDRILVTIKNQKFKEAAVLLSNEPHFLNEKKQLSLYNILTNEYGVFKLKPKVNAVAIEKSNSEYATSLNFLNLGLYQLLYQYNNENEAFKNLNLALKHAEISKSKPLKCEVYKAIFNYYYNLVTIENDRYLIYLNEYQKNLYDHFEQLNYKTIKLSLALFSNSKKTPTEDLSELKLFSEQESNAFLRGKINKSLGIYYDLKLHNYKLASFYYKKAQTDFSKDPTGESMIGERSSEICNAVTKFYLKNFNASIADLKKIDTSYSGKNYSFNKLYKYLWLSNSFQQIKKFDSAYYYLKKENNIKNQLEQSKHDAINSELSVKYESQKRELEKLNLKTKNEQEILWIYICIALLFIGSIIAYLKVNNLRKKGKIAIQEKELQNERYEKTLKDHELNSIESMLEGQEKERIKIANDLHDNLGSMLVTLKLNFQNLKERRDTLKTEEDRLYEKTDNLLEEAYQKVRTIAHTRNAGVITGDGLVPAIKNIASKVSVPGILDVEVIAFGIENRLENTMEISIFRMIQEILTNIIKHSGASNATIQLTQHDNSLNIIIEDNGKGFNTSSLDSKKGMGLNNIKKKVQHLNGTFSIDSFEGKGTTILIDIPI